MGACQARLSGPKMMMQNEKGQQCVPWEEDKEEM